MWYRVTNVLVLGLALAQVALAQQPGEISYHDESAMPAGIEGQRIQSLIDVFNSGEPDRVRQFIEEQCTGWFHEIPMEEHLEVFSNVRHEWGGVDFHSVRSYVPERTQETVVILKDRNFGAWRAFSVRFEDSAERRLTGLRLNDARTPSNVDEPALTRRAALAMMEEVIERVCENAAFSGTALIASGDDVLGSYFCGQASKRFDVPNNIDTKFNLGSMNKMFTATAVAQLVERGLVAYDDPISRYVDETWLPKEITDRVTVHHLLSHTSGLGDYFTDEFWESSRLKWREIDAFKELAQGQELEFAPGERFRYSNLGMLIAGVVIESASGQSYFDYIRENIYEPAGMTNSDSYEIDEPVPNLAIGYLRDPESEYGYRDNNLLHVAKGGPAGGGYSTVGDLFRFSRALVTGKLVSEASLETMWTPKSDAGYGYGFGVGEGPAGTVVGHSGGFPGINGELAIYVDAGYTVAVLSNYSNAASPLCNRLQQLVERIQ
ncbi:MAG TPA: serine hydrolase domain-containing protein [Gemmatimonadota bacterium]|nr:serine hydrolase domain-containing protein [Gemmatimonadota bacterium]